MMQMAQAGGLRVLTDGLRAPDEHNPRGYFEDERVKHSRTDLSWLDEARGAVVKMVCLLLPYLPADRKYQVIFMLRDVEEVLVSQRVMLQRQGRPTASLTDTALAGVFKNQVAAARRWLAEQPNFRVLYVNYRDLIDAPGKTAGQVNAFLGGNLAVTQMAGVVSPALYHQRKSAPESLENKTQDDKTLDTRRQLT